MASLLKTIQNLKSKKKENDNAEENERGSFETSEGAISANANKGSSSNQAVIVKKEEMTPDDFTVDDVKEAFAPHAEYLKNAGMTIKDALPKLLDHFNHATKDPRGFITKIAHGAGMKVIMDDTPVTPEEKEAMKQAAQEIEAFSKDKTPEEMEKLAPMMHSMIAYGIHTDLPSAYESAKWATPETREKKIQELKNSMDMDKAKKASKSISNSPVERKVEKNNPQKWEDLRKISGY